MGPDSRLYELSGFPDHLAQQVEQLFFRPVDTKASICLDEIERYKNGVQWDAEKRSAWSRFILSLLLRCPEDLATFREKFRASYFNVSAETQAYYASIKDANFPETMEEWLSTRSPQEIERMLFTLFVSMHNAEAVGNFLNNMIWRIVRVDHPKFYLFTSDRPIIRTNSLSSDDGHIVLPIGPNLMFLAAKKWETIRRIEGTRL